MAKRKNSTEFQPNISLLRQGDELEWEKLQRTYWRRVYYFIRRFIEDHQVCEDIVQDTFHGAARGIGDFDRRYNIEQYLFGIAKNRLIDHLRRKIPTPVSPQSGEDDGPMRMLGLQDSLHNDVTASQIMRKDETARRRRAAIARTLKLYVEELKESKEFTKLKVIESIFVSGKRNKDIWQKFSLRDESSVAGIKFRAIERLQSLARLQDKNHSLFPGLWEKRW